MLRLKIREIYKVRGERKGSYWECSEGKTPGLAGHKREIRTDKRGEQVPILLGSSLRVRLLNQYISLITGSWWLNFVRTAPGQGTFLPFYRVLPSGFM